MTDPWTWTVEQVVHNLCDLSDLWSDRQNSKRPNSALLKQRLIEQQIDGATLIDHVDRKTLKEELGINALGEVASILYAIDKLKDLSPRYVETQAQNLFRQDSVSRAVSEFRQPQSSFKSPLAGAITSSAVFIKRQLSPTPVPVRELPVASENGTNMAATAEREATERPQKKRRVQLLSLIHI